VGAPLDANAVRALVREELARLLGRALAEDRVYSTRRGEAPPGYGRDVWRAIAHSIGTRRGRYHFVSADRLAAYEAAKHEPVAPPTAPAQRRPWHPRDSAEDANLRLVGGKP
jgi:hypothetical protein